MTALKHSPLSRQRGAVLVFALIALVVLLIGGVVMVRSMQTTLISAGNFGFKRDLVNQSERAVDRAYATFAVGGLLEGNATRFNALPAANYAASMLPTNDQGIPNALLVDDTAFAAVGRTANDIVTAQGVRIRYVIDRMCIAGYTGAADPESCSMAGPRPGMGISATAQLNVGVKTKAGPAVTVLQPIYRVTMRVTGPRGTESFFQSTFAL